MANKRLVIHLDDLGASHSANAAFADLWQSQAISAASVMAPCANFAEAVLMTRGKLDDDVGLHLTLNAEFDTMRWRPMIGPVGHGLHDESGAFFKTVEEVRKADPEAVEAELRTQIETALAAGLLITHLDTHMGALYAPEFIAIYERLGTDYGVPIVLARSIVEEIGLTETYAPLFERLESRGNPVFDGFVSTPFDKSDPQPEDYAALLDGLPDGLSYGAFHCATRGDIEQFAPDAATRLAEHRLFSAGVIKRLAEERGIEIVGMRNFHQAMSH